jgi:PRTRC genetic system protein C
MAKTAITRKFKFGEVVLDDPNPNFTPERVMSFYSAQYPALTTARLSGPTNSGDTQVFEFQTSVGTKG